jgi:hypothetical protein
MKFSFATAVLAATFAVAACDRPDPVVDRPAGTGSTQGPKDTSPSQTQNSPANLPRPSEAEKERESNKPQQGQVDPKQPEQNRDFKRGQ